MKQTKNIPKGYKDSPVGVIPKEWRVYKLENIIIENKLGGNYENSESNEGVPVIKMGNVGRGVINLEKIQCLPQRDFFSTEDILQKGDLLFNTRNTLDLVGKVAVWRGELDFAIYNSNLLKIVFDPSYVDSSYYMNYIFNSHIGLSQLRGIATGTTSVAAIYNRDLEKILFPLPSLVEQKKIVEILSTWDEAINKQSQLVIQLQLRKKALMQQLLSGKKRLKGFTKEWKEYKIRNFAKEYSLKNKGNKELTVLSCTKYDGLVPSLEYFGRQVFSDDISTYKLVPKGYFAYATNHIEEGSIGYQDFINEGVISPMYTVFKTDENINDYFLYPILKSHKLIYEYNARMEGSIDRRGGLRWEAFSSIKVRIPSYEEQTAIAKVLFMADYEINFARQKLDALRTQKKGLMQQLLTGKKRVQIN